MSAPAGKPKPAPDGLWTTIDALQTTLRAAEERAASLEKEVGALLSSAAARGDEPDLLIDYWREAERRAEVAEAQLAEATRRIAEREACARIADEQAAGHERRRAANPPATGVGNTGALCLEIGGKSAASVIAAAIRSRAASTTQGTKP